MIDALIKTAAINHVEYYGIQCMRAEIFYRHHARIGEFMRRLLVALTAICLLSATVVSPVFADGWGGHYHRSGYGFNPLWPIAAAVNAALYIPAAIIGTIAQLATPQPVGYAYAPSPVPVRVYTAAPAPDSSYYAARYSYTQDTNTYYAPAPRPYNQQRVYVAPSDSFTPPYYVVR